MNDIIKDVQARLAVKAPLTSVRCDIVRVHQK